MAHGMSLQVRLPEVFRTAGVFSPFRWALGAHLLSKPPCILDAWSVPTSAHPSSPVYSVCLGQTDG